MNSLGSNLVYVVQNAHVCTKCIWAQLFKGWITLSTGIDVNKQCYLLDSDYPVDSVIHLLNNRALMFIVQYMYMRDVQCSVNKLSLVVKW